MAKRSSSSEQLKLALDILRRIPRHTFKSAQEIHNELINSGWEKSERTVQRTLKELTEEFDIYCNDRSKPYGYRWQSSAKGFSFANLSLQESLMLNLSEQYLKELLPPSLLRSMQGFFDYSRQRFVDPCDHDNNLEKQWLQKVMIVSERQPLLAPEINKKVFQAVTEALYRNRYLRLKYKNAKDELSEPRVQPLGLVQQGVRFYLACRYPNNEDYSLAIHRIQDARAETLSFDPPKDFVLESYARQGRFNFGDGKYVKLRLEVKREAAMYLEETPLSRDQTIENLSEGYIEICATVVDSLLLDKFINSFGDALRLAEKELTEKSSSKRNKL